MTPAWPKCGHPRTPENTRPNGHAGACRICCRARTKRWRDRQAKPKGAPKALVALASGAKTTTDLCEALDTDPSCVFRAMERQRDKGNVTKAVTRIGHRNVATYELTELGRQRL